MFTFLKQPFKHLLATILCLSFFMASGQPRFRPKPEEVPVYRSPEDSIKLAEIDHRIEAAYNVAGTPEDVLDHLLTLREKISQEGILRFRRVYYPDEGMVSWDSLSHVRDLTQVLAITLEGKSLKRLPRKVLACRNLQALELVNCRIARIQSLKKLRSFKTLTILNNTGTRPLRFAQNKTITTVTIHGERSASLPLSFKNLPNLRKLDLSECDLTSFPSGIYRNRKLEELQLQNNRITLENDRLKPLPSLLRLGLQHNLIRVVPSGISNFHNLRRLNFNHNKIVEVAPAIGLLKKLEYLSFYNNALTSIPAGLYDLTSLKLIDLYFNQIDEVPDDIARWQELEILFISHNRIWTLPDTLLSLQKITELYAYDNRLVKLPTHIDKLSKLRVLRVNQNFLKEIPSSLMNLQEVEELDFSDNYLPHLPPAIFDFRNLKVITCVNNPFDTETLELLHRKLEEFQEKEIFLHFSGAASKE
jgi:Leucine-rich repeat (LRR) protein